MIWNGINGKEFTKTFEDGTYAVISRYQLCIHLQWHIDNEENLFSRGSVLKLFLPDVKLFIFMFILRGTITENNFRRNTPLTTSKFSYYDLNKNTIYFMQDL